MLLNRTHSNIFETSEAVVWRCSVEKVFLEILQNSQKKHSILDV